MKTASGATAVNVAKPTNLSAPMIHAFPDNICYITIELNGSTQYDTRDDVPCDLDTWRETCARFPARWPVVRLERDLELNRSAHHWDEGSRSLSPEDRVCAAVEVVE